MGKVISVFDTPCSCYECPHALSNYSVCGLNHITLERERYHKRTIWCPLRELPEREAYDDILGDDFDEGYVYGWNKCLDVILGGSSNEQTD